MLKNASSLEKLGFVLIVLAYFVSFAGLQGTFAWVGVAMAGAGTIMGLLKKNWIIVALGAIDTYILVDYALAVDQINGIMDDYEDAINSIQVIY